MKRFLTLIYTIFFSIHVLSQISSTGYTLKINAPLGDQCTLETLKNYLNSNSSNLDPIEGLYDAKWTSYVTYARYGSRNSESSCCIGVVRGENGFYLYAPYNNGYGLQSWLLIQRIGNTPLYNFIYLDEMEVGIEKLISSKERVLLKDKMFWIYSHAFSNSERSHMTCSDVICTYTREISAIKFFPTQLNDNETPSQWSGTGFAINNRCIATNYHVIEGANIIKVKGVQGNFNTEYRAKVVSVDKINDLSIIEIEDKKFKGFGFIPYKIKADASNVGEEIFVLGYPLTATMGDEIKLTTGVISAKTGFKGNAALYQISAPIQPGNSGGPLFDSHGDLIGIVNAKHKDAENVSYAIKASYLLNLMKKVALKNTFSQTNSISSLNLSGKVKKIQTAVFMIVCSK